MGRHRKPTALKVLQGNPGKRPLPENEPVPPEGEVVRPKMRSKRATRVWDEYAPMVTAMGLLTPVDVPAFAMLCALIAESERDPEGMAAARIGRMESLFSRFGMDPSSRARLGSAAPRSRAKGNAFGALAG